ncbi:glycosyltransferase family 4 protein [Neobacillus sp. PS2-9]|uniref:glycosyltransferase family 4 protein n=1 Tax=Neobacillus sp. PS2-9 TaxID=3070676 RepID=UPI0027DF8CE1|nr:glycosyltransferase family 4 protein [Neobacillus sp. PS2-9]WML58028.1 glycosyltransferase family 4 protein [Neobacillus sp. PS2-9]
MIQELRSKEFNRRLERYKLANSQKLIQSNKNIDQLHIVYAMTHVGISGGVKIILEHANRLQKAGAKVTLVSHFQKPSWYPIEAEYIQVPFELELAKGIPLCDLIVATYWDHIQACMETGIAPVVYFEQGDFHLFDYDSMNRTLKNFIQKQFEISPFIYTVSHQAAKLITNIYGREAQVFPNAVDEDVFTTDGEKEKGDRPYLLMVGGESAKFKGISDIITAYDKVKNEFNMDLYWITPEQPSEAMKKRVTKVFVNPTQQKISNLYRGASLFICGSTYESFSLPTLEAMACGCPVVTTNNAGVLEYAVDQENAYICQMKNPDDMAEKIVQVLGSQEIQSKLRKNGLQTAQKYKWETIINDILHYYKNIASYNIQSSNDLNNWEIGVNAEQFLNQEDYGKLKRFLLVTHADIVKAPVIYSFDKAPKIARWEVIAHRKNGSEGNTEHCFCPLKPTNKLQLFNLPGYSSFLLREYEKALDDFIYLHENQENPKDKAVAARWIIITLMRLQRKQQAKKRVKEWISQYPHNADFYLLNALLLDEAKIKSSSIESVKLLGDATSYSEFFFHVQSLWEALLADK